MKTRLILVTCLVLTTCMYAQASEFALPEPKSVRDVAAEMAKRHKMTPEQVRRHFDEKLCFNCSKSGHPSRNCTEQKRGN